MLLNVISKDMCIHSEYNSLLQDMALLLTWVGSSLLLSICLSGSLSSEVIVRRISEGLTSVPQDITTKVTKLDLDNNKILVLHDKSFHNFQQINNIKVNNNPIWKISNGTFDNNLLLREFHCFMCKLRVLPSSFGPIMSKLKILDVSAAIPDTDILVSPYFDGFTSLDQFWMLSNNLYDIDHINIPTSITLLRLEINKLFRFPNVSSLRFPYLIELALRSNDLTVISDSELASMSSTFRRLNLIDNQLIQLGDVTLLNNLGGLWLDGNELETIPDLLMGLPNLWVLSTRGNTRMACDHRMCWRRLWDRVRSQIPFGDDVKCMAPLAARGYRLSLISPGFMQCDQGNVW